MPEPQDHRPFILTLKIPKEHKGPMTLAARFAGKDTIGQPLSINKWAIQTLIAAANNNPDVLHHLESLRRNPAP